MPRSRPRCFPKFQGGLVGQPDRGALADENELLVAPEPVRQRRLELLLGQGRQVLDIVAKVTSPQSEHARSETRLDHGFLIGKGQGNVPLGQPGHGRRLRAGNAQYLGPGREGLNEAKNLRGRARAKITTTTS